LSLGELKKLFGRHVSNLPGWCTNRKIVVIESDDWGSIRMPSMDAFEKLKRNGLDLFSLDAERYNKNDTMATSKDLEVLFEVLGRVKGSNGSNAVFTPVTIVANPDFAKIKNSHFKEYYYEPFTETLKRYRGCENAIGLWYEGIRSKVFVPQMHGREHLNVSSWIYALQKQDWQTHMAFNEGFWGFVPDKLAFPGIDFQAAFLLKEPSDIENHKIIIREGLNLFEKLFAYRATYFVPPNGPFNNTLNEILAENGIKFRSVAKIQKETIGYDNFRKSFHWLGQKERNNITYITRNCFFEPSQPGKDWINSCLNEMQIAFRMKKPAIISSHRVNYVGGLSLKNRDQGLSQLSELLRIIVKRWPSAEFMTTARLGEIMLGEE